ncbi:hypothetical protein PG988_004458 [Apiospora saccharicola]
MEESQRLACEVAAFVCNVVRPMDLSDYPHLPAGTNLHVPFCGTSDDERYSPSPRLWLAFEYEN